MSIIAAHPLLLGWVAFRTLIGLVAGLVCLVTIPLVCELLVLTVAAKLPRRASVQKDTARQVLGITCVVPAHNEEKLIGRCVRSLRRDIPNGCRVLVVAHRCSDRTAEAAREAGAEVLILGEDSPAGKGTALHAGFRQALAQGAGAVAVVDADSIVSDGFLKHLQQALSAGAEAVQARYTVLDGGTHKHTSLVTLAFHGFNVIRPRGREWLGLSSGIFGNGFAIRSEVLRRVPFGALSLVEDLEYHLSLVRSGVRVRFLEEAEVRSEMPARCAGGTQRARWEGGRIRMIRLHAPRLFGDVIRGRFVALEPLMDVLSLPIAQAVALLGLGLCLPLTSVRIYALVSLAVIVLHTLAADLSDRGMLARMGTLAYVPAYILWKIWLLPRTLISAKADAAWIRTGRTFRAEDLPGHIEAEESIASVPPEFAQSRS